MKRLVCIIFALMLALSGCRKNNLEGSSFTVTEMVVSEMTSVTEKVSSFEESSSAESEIPSVSTPTPPVGSAAEIISTPSAVEPPVEEIETGSIGINGGLWLSFMEINELLTSKKGFKTEFNQVIRDMKSLGLTDLYFHIRSHCDSVVKSDYFPQTEKSQKAGYDILQYAIDTCHSKGIKIHGWINPYRVTASHSDIGKLPDGSPAKKWINEGKSLNVVVMNGIYLNPAENEVRKLIVDGVRELIGKYSLDGIHFDDYFYPTADPLFDEASYESYKNATKNPLSQLDWRRANVDILISDTKTAIDLSGKTLIFSISPSANIEKNYSLACADVKGWSQKGLIDEVIPQIYFGFNHTDEKFNFDSLLNEWVDLVGETEVKLKIGLAPYKVGTVSPTDGDEWQKNTDILARQVKLCNETEKVEGVVFFSYSTLFSEKGPNTRERENLKLTPS